MQFQMILKIDFDVSPRRRTRLSHDTTTQFFECTDVLSDEDESRVCGAMTQPCDAQAAPLQLSTVVSSLEIHSTVLLDLRSIMYSNITMCAYVSVYI